MADLYATLAETSAAWGCELTPKQIDEVRGYTAAVRSHSKKINLTGAEDTRSLLFRHMADGLAAVSLLKSLAPDNPQILDLGSGAGFIGIAVKIAWPEARVTLMEAREKRFKFLSLAAARLGTKGLRVVRRRAGESTLSEGKFDIVIERALAPLPEALAIAIPLLKEGGHFIAYASAPPAKTLALATARLIKSHPYRLPEEERDRFLLVFRKLDKET